MWQLIGAAVGLGLVAIVSFVPRTARAFTIESVVTSGCHEAITERAIRRIKLPVIMPTDDDNALLDDLPFGISNDLKNITVAALLIGVRDNDLKGRGSRDLAELALVHGDPEGQAEHCLRSSGDDGEDGVNTAILKCRSFIRGRVIEALDAGPNDRTPVRVTLDLRGVVDAELPTRFVRLGQALHAVQDSYTHTYRTPDAKRILTVLNWIDEVDGTRESRRDGPPHLGVLDRCEEDLPIVQARVQEAEDASQILLAIATSTEERALKITRLDQLLDRVLTTKAGCSYDNNYCNAPELALIEAPSCQCSHGPNSSGNFPFFGLLLSLLFICRTKANICRNAILRRASLVTLATILGCAPRNVWASDSSLEQSLPDVHLLEAKHDVGRSRLGMYVAVGGSIDRTALAGSIGLRVRIAEHTLAGFDVEWNPWASLDSVRVRPGALNVYGTLIRRFPLLAERFDLRTTIHIGTSTALFALYGVPQGSTGLYFGVNLLGIEWRVSRLWSLVMDPADVAFPIPQLRGAPFGYLQYRFTVGLQFGG